jgi:hypothetical protein
MGVILWRPSTTLKARQLRSLEDCALSKNVALLNIKTFWSLCSSSRHGTPFGRASGVIKPQNSLNQSLKAVWREIDFGRLGRNYGRFLTVARSFRIAEVVGPGRSTFQLPDTTRAASRLIELNCVHFGFADDARGTGSFAVNVNS